MKQNWIKVSLALVLALVTLLAMAAPALAATTISSSKAKSIALESAGLKASEVSSIRVKRDYDDGRRIYEVEIYANYTEYDFDIDAITGDVRSYDIESKKRRNTLTGGGIGSSTSGRTSSSTTNSGSSSSRTNNVDATSGATSSTGSTGSTGSAVESSSSGAITVSEAKSIALSHAGLSASEVRFTKSRRERDDGRIVFDIEFRKGRMEYEYEINASTGKILEWDKDYDD